MGLHATPSCHPGQVSRSDARAEIHLFVRQDHCARQDNFFLSGLHA
jgi:hypothetical protein